MGNLVLRKYFRHMVQSGILKLLPPYHLTTPYAVMNPLGLEGQMVASKSGWHWVTNIFSSILKMSNS